MSTVIQILKDLVEIDTTHEKDTLCAVEYIENYLADYNIKSRLVYKNDNPSSKRATIIASIGNVEKPGIIFSGHLDVVSVNGQENEWNTNPFHAVRIDNKIYGRGTTDMKGAISCLLGNIDALIKLSETKPVHLVFTHDEEGGFTAINQLYNNRFYNIIPAKQDGCIVVEPTNMNLVIGHKGNKRIRIKCTGKEYHASNPSMGVDAIACAVNLYNSINLSFNNIEWKQNSLFSPQQTVMNIGKITGGKADSLVADYCEMDLCCRYIPDDSYDNIPLFFQKIEENVSTVNRIFNGPKVEIEHRNHVLPLNENNNDVFVSRVLQHSNSNRPETVSYGSEAGYFSAMGIPAVIIGPGHTLRAHKPNEYIGIDELNCFETFIKNFTEAEILSDNQRRKTSRGLNHG